MKIFFPIGRYYPSQVGGPANTIYWHCRALKAKDIHPTVISTMIGIQENEVASNEWLNADSGKVYYSKKGIFSPKTLRNISIQIAQCDILHLNSLFSPFSIYSFFYKSLFFPKKKVIWSVRGELSESALTFSSWKKKPLLFLYKRLNKNVTYHSTSKQETKNIEATFPGREIIEIPNLMVPADRLNIPVSKNILFLGRIHPIKGLEKLIKSLPMSKTFMNSDSKLIIVGKHNSKNDEYHSKLLSLVNSLALQKKVVFKGHLEGKEKEEICASSYALILPSESENFGMVVIEALNQGTPVIASTGTPWSILEKNNAGLHVSNDPKSLAKAIDELLSLDKEDYNQMRMNGVKLIDKNYIADTQIYKWIDLYEKAVQE